MMQDMRSQFYCPVGRSVGLLLAYLLSNRSLRTAANHHLD